MVAYVTVVFVFDHPLSFCRGCFDHALVVSDNLIFLLGQLRGQCTGDSLGTVYLLRSVYADGRTEVSIVYMYDSKELSARGRCCPGWEIR